MATGLNGRTPAILGAVLVALMLIFGFLNGVPWERRGAPAEGWLWSLSMKCFSGRG